MNVLLTRRCNRRCPYCFAAARISYSSASTAADTPSRAPEEISLDDFARCVDFAAASRLRLLGLLGGEPSLHSRFVELLPLAWNAGLDVKVFTNGLWPEPTIAAFERLAPPRPRRVNFVLNVNHPDITPGPEQQAQTAFLERLGRSCALSFNIYRADFDPSFLVDTVLRYGTRRDIRLGVAQPLAEGRNEYVEVADYRRLAPAILRLAAACDEHDITLGFDCGFTLCMFSPEELGRLHLAGARFRAGCGPVVDVGTDLSVWACFPLSTLSPGARLSDFADMHAAVRHFHQRFARLYRTGALPECVGCRHRRRGLCKGGCAAHVFRRFNP